MSAPLAYTIRFLRADGSFHRDMQRQCCNDQAALQDAVNALDEACAAIQIRRDGQIVWQGLKGDASTEVAATLSTK